MSTWSLKNKKIVVTGGSKGIGYATTRCLLSHGAEVLICARTKSALTTCIENLKQEFHMTDQSNEYKGKMGVSFESGSAGSGIRIHGFECDISTEEGRSNLVNKVSEIFGSELHCLVNNVGRNIRKDISNQTEEEYSSMMQTNVDSVYFLCQKFQTLLANGACSSHKYSSVVNVASAAGVQSSGTGAVYGMSKAAVIQFTKILACEWAKLNIRVNAVAPWMTMTPMLEEAVREDPSQLDKVKEWTPMNRLATVEEVANPIVFLCMDCSSYITGQCVGVDGGLTAQGFQGPCV